MLGVVFLSHTSGSMETLLVEARRIFESRL
jgi:hypothetical protein